jgi:(p)ppGpp synthase/HD superfamily hydrolase
MASFLHRKQTRFVRGDLPRVPYIEHPLRVALRLVRWGVPDAELIAAALLHDVVEDCSTELLEASANRGRRLPRIACRVSSDNASRGLWAK